MQVDPRTLIDDTELPDDLAALAGQLKGEAEELAECYPAGKIHPVLKEVLAVQLKENDRTRRFRSGIVAAMVPLLILFGSAALLFTLQSGGGPAEAGKSASTKSANSSAPTTVVSTPTVQNEEAPRELTTEFGRDLSGPEVEGLIDIWDRDKTVIRRVSF